MLGHMGNEEELSMPLFWFNSLGQFWFWFIVSTSHQLSSPPLDQINLLFWHELGVLESRSHCQGMYENSDFLLPN